MLLSPRLVRHPRGGVSRVSMRFVSTFRCVSMRFDAFHLFCLFVSFGGLGGVLVLGVSNSLEFGVCEVNILQVVEVVPVLRVKHQNKLWLGQLFNFPRLHLRSNRGLIVSFDPKVFEVKIQRLDIFIFLFFFFATLLAPSSHWFAESFEFVEIHADMRYE